MIQSDQYPPNELSDRAATWMHESLNVLKNVSNTELKRLKDAVAIQFRREIKTIPDQLERIVFEAITLKGQFGYNEAVAKEAEKLTKNDMIEAFKNAFNNKSKKSLSVYLSKKGIKDFKVKEKVIQDELKFKAHAKYY
ncbi:MAG: hypothetical protein R3B45_07825 [Bdellovibrionota bacterium]